MKIRTDFRQITKLQDLVDQKIIRAEHLKTDPEEIILFFEKRFAAKREYCVIRPYGYHPEDFYIELSGDRDYNEISEYNYKDIYKLGMITQEEFNTVDRYYTKIKQEEKAKKERKELKRLSKLYNT